jgi:hypothetical protein
VVVVAVVVVVVVVVVVAVVVVVGVVVAVVVPVVDGVEVEVEVVERPGQFPCGFEHDFGAECATAVAVRRPASTRPIDLTQVQCGP